MLELRGISAGYGSHIVVRDVNLWVPDRSVVALLGANGAGKTTLLRVASGLLPPKRGQLLIDDEDFTGAPSHALARAGVCHVPEGRGVFPSLSVQTNIRLQAPADVDLAAVDEVAAMFPRLGERLSQAAGTLSGGEQQMLAVAHACVAKAPIVLVDEVSMGLAPKIVDELYVSIQRLAEQGASILLVEQYVRRALALADYVYVLRKGSIEFAGEPGELLSDQLLSAYIGG